MRLGCAESASIRMPDTSHQRERVENFERNASSALISRGMKGGVLQNRNCKLCTVNIRPSKWNEKNNPCKFWIGKLSYGWAQYKADTIYHYTGKSRFHFKGVDLIFPDLEFIGTEINTLVLLTTEEMRYNYVHSIAGEGFAVHREDFIQKVMNVMESIDFIRQGERLLNSREKPAAPSEATAIAGEEEAVIPEAAVRKEEAAAPGEEAAIPKEKAAVPAEGAVRIKDDDDREEDTPPLEDDPMSWQALRHIQSQFSAPLSSDVSKKLFPTRLSHVPGSDTGLVGLNLLQAYAPTFEINPNSFGKKILHSAGQSFDLTSFAMEDCPTTLKEDEEKLQSWIDTVSELNAEFCWSCMEGPLDSEFVSAAHTIADAEKLNNAKRQKIGD